VVEAVVDVDVLVEVAVKVVVVFSAVVVGDATTVDVVANWIAKAGSTFLVVVVEFFFRRVTTSSIIRSVCLVCTVVGALVYVLTTPFLFPDPAGFTIPPF
jgi:hypothetical protein